MNNLHKRPLFLFGITFAVSSVVFASLSSLIKIIIAAVMLILATIAVIIGHKTNLTHKIILCVLLSCMLSACLSVYFFNIKLDKFEALDATTCDAEITILDTRYSSENFGCYTAEILPDIPQGRRKIKVSLETTDGSYAPGDILSGQVTLYALSDTGIYNERTMYLPDGIMLSAESDSLVFKGHDSSFSIQRTIKELNKKLAARFYAHLDDDAGGLAAAVLLGNKENLSDSLSRNFARLGISHLLAISGLHLSVIIFLLEKLLAHLRVKKFIRNPIYIIFIIFFTALTGFSFSIIRAGIMHIIRIAASSLGKSSDSLTSLSLSAALIIFINPYSVLDCGFWLSALSSYACIIYAMLESEKSGKVKKYGKALQRRIVGILKGMFATVKLTLLIIIFTLPVMWYTFGEISIISPFTNIIYIPFVTVYLYLSIIYMLLYPLGLLIPPLSSVMNITANLIAVSSDKLASLRGIVISLRYPFLEYFVFALFVTAVIYPFVKTKLRRILKVCALLSIGGFAVCLLALKIPEAHSAEGSYVNSKKNDGLVIRSELEYILVDVSDGSYGFAREMLYTAKEMRATEINSYVLTHYHKKHTATIERLTNNAVVRNVILPFPETEDDASTMESVISVCKSKNINVILYDRADGETISCSGTELRFFEYTALARSTHPIITLSASYKSNNVLYLGSSFNESNDVVNACAESSSTVILGAHPPKYKEEIDLETEAEIIASSNAYSFMTDSMKQAYPGAVVLSEDKNRLRFEME